MLEDEPEKVPDTAALLEQLRESLDAARSMPMSASVMINRDEFGEILQDAIDGLPEELRAGALAAEGARRGARAGRSARPSGSSTSPGSGPSGWSRRTRSCARPGGPAEEIVDDAGRLAAPDAPRGRGLRRPQARQLRGRARPHDADGRRRAGSGSRCTRPSHEDLLGPDADEAEQAFFDQDDL